MRVRLDNGAVFLVALVYSAYIVKDVFSSGFKFAFLASVFALAVLFAHKRPPLARLAAGWPMFLFFGFAVASLAWTNNVASTLESLTLPTGQVALFSITLLGLSCTQARRFDIVPMVISLVIIMYGCFVIITHGALRGVAVGESGDAYLGNFLASIAVLLIPLHFYAATFLSGRRRHLNKFALFGCVVIVLVSESRQAFAMLALEAFLLLGFLVRGHAKKILSFSFLGIFFVSVILMFLPDAMLHNPIDAVALRFGKTADELFYVFSGYETKGRGALWRLALSFAQDTPLLFGNGWGSFRIYIYDYTGAETTAHNLLLTARGELGILGLGAAVLLLSSSIWFPLRTAIRARRFGRLQEKQFWLVITLCALVGGFQWMVRPNWSNVASFYVLALALSSTRLQRCFPHDENVAVSAALHDGASRKYT